MRLCRFCGNGLQEWENGCTACGAGISQETGEAVQAMPLPAAVPEVPRFVPRQIAPVQRVQAAAPAAAAVSSAVTEPAGWFGWTVLCVLLWIIGPLMMYRTVKDPSARNFARMMLTLEAIAVGLLALGVIGLGGLVMLDRLIF